MYTALPCGDGRRRDGILGRESLLNPIHYGASLNATARIFKPAAKRLSFSEGCNKSNLPAALFNTIVRIIPGSSQEKMVWTHTSVNVTFVENPKIAQNRPVMNLPRKSMSKARFSLPLHRSVP
jgi:hypothetical protein